MRLLHTAWQVGLVVAILAAIWGSVFMHLRSEYERAVAAGRTQGAAKALADVVGVDPAAVGRLTAGAGEADESRPPSAAAVVPDGDPFDRYRSDRVWYGLGAAALTMLVAASGALLLIARRRINRFQDVLAATLDNMSQGLIMIDERRRTPLVNRRFSELLGLPEGLARPNGSFDDILNWQIATGDLTVPAGQNGIAGMLARQGGLDAAVPVYERTRPDGTEIEVRTVLLPTGGAVRTYTDITARKQTERALSAARDAAEAASRTRTDFLAMMSHEIRTPLNGIIGVAGLLMDMDLSEDHRAYLEVIRTSGDHLLELLNDILDLSRLDAGRLDLEELVFDLPHTIDGAMRLLAGQAAAKGLRLVCNVRPDLPVWVAGDPARLRQILLNLVGNAVKFTDAGGIRVDASVAVEPESEPAHNDQKACRIAIAVSDTGIGIPPDAVERLFQPFIQGDTSSSRRFGGSGLGLAICRKLVEQMGGSIRVDSTPGHGSTFRFDFLVRPTDARAEAPQSDAPSGPARRLRVLVAEDNATNRLVAIRMLERMGHRVDAVADGAEALQALQAMPYDLVLMDVMMPGMDGIAATRRIRMEAGAMGQTPVVGLTANAQPVDERNCRDAGMDGFVTKPVTAQRLAAAIEAVTGSHDVSSRPAMTIPHEPPDEETAPILDHAFLADLAEAIGTDGAIEAIGLFREDAPDRIAVMHASLPHDPARVRREAHALAGASRNIGLVRLGNAASALQHAVEKAEPMASDVAALALLVDESLTVLAAWEQAAAASVT